MKKSFLLVTLILSLFSIVFAEDSIENVEKTAEVEITTITINNARETNYKKDEETGNDVILLEGAVELSIEKGESVSDIKADKISYDRSTEMLYAEGNVVITTKSSSSGGETTTANSLLLNSSTLEGVFDGGKVVQTKSDALNLPSGSTLIVFSDAFGKGNDNVIAFKNSSLTFCDDDNPHWHIDATRTWLLPGGEFAFFNALLYVGPVPVLYFPAFYYPKDELIFNPVFSYKKRAGYSVQTTTYLYGRKSLADSVAESSDDGSDNEKKEDDKIDSDALYNFMKPTTLKKQKLEGIVLHNLDEDYEGDTSKYLKVMFDWYSNLGIYLGVDGKLSPSKDYLTDLSFFLDFGFSNTLFKDKDNYYPFSKNGKTYKDSSIFLGISMPFRYAGNLSLTLSKPFYLSVSLPIYSDPFFVSDFKSDRSESMDWISFLLDDDKKNKKDSGSGNEISSFSWKITSSYNQTIPEVIRPYLNNLSFNFDSSVNFSSLYTDRKFLSETEKDFVEKEWLENTPLRRFYYPSYIKPAQLSMNISGTLFSWPMPKKNKSNEHKEFPITLNKPDELKTDKELEEERKKEAGETEKNNDKNNDKNNEGNIEENKDPLKDFKYYLPDFSVNVPGVTRISGLTYNLNYSFETNLSSQISYSSAKLKKPDDFDWKNIQSYMYTLRLPLSVTSSFNYGSGFFSMNNNFSYNPVMQNHPFISTDESNGGYSKNGAGSLILADYKAERQDVVNNNSVVFKPFVFINMFKDTSISWNSNLKIYTKEFSGTVENPAWESKYFDIKDEKSFTENSLSLKIASSQFDNKFSQSFSFSYVMPPLLTQYNFNLQLKFPFVTTDINTGFYETSKDKNKGDDKWKKKPLVQNLSLSLFNSKLNFSQSYTYNIEKKESENLRLSVSFMGLNAAYTMAYLKGYDFDNGWHIREKEEFLPTSLSVSYNTPNKTFKTWNDKISFTPGLNTSIVADLLRPTNSYFLFSPSITLNITNFLKITFSSTSKNSVLYWYFHNEPGDLYSEWGGFPGNIIKDLVNSFRFDNNSIRESSGFKLKSLNLDLEHDLHDWKLNMSLKIEPRIITENNKKRYDFKPYFSIGIVWNPMESMKTEIKDEYGEWEIH